MLDKKFSHEGGEQNLLMGMRRMRKVREMRGIVLAYTQRQRGCVANFDS